ncbi:MAG TPA: hypothetical protein VGP72_18705 [Planctomycetota bacterium]|jgi:hypothetical protein
MGKKRELNPEKSQALSSEGRRQKEKAQQNLIPLRTGPRPPPFDPEKETEDLLRALRVATPKGQDDALFALVEQLVEVRGFTWGQACTLIQSSVGGSMLQLEQNNWYGEQQQKRKRARQQKQDQPQKGARLHRRA